MYQAFYNLKIKPFQITTDPKFLWLGEKHKEALATLKYGILENKGFLLLTGDVGTGKTVLIHGLVKIIDISAIVATIPDPGLSSMDFFNFLSEEFKMNRRFDTKGAFLIHLKHFLYKASASDKKVLLVIDEAQRLNHALLEQIRLLSNIEMDNRKLINIFFVGQSEFNRMLNEERNKAVKQRITVSYHIDPLTQKETRDYINHRLKVAGGDREIFKPEALHKIYAFSHGYPRLVNIICDHALLTGYSAGKKAIDADVIKECEKELRIPINNADREAKEHEFFENQPSALSVLQNRSMTKRIGFLAIIILLLLFAGFVLYKFQLRDAPPWKIEEIAPQSYESPTLKSKESFLPGIENQRTTLKELPVVKRFEETTRKDNNLSKTDEPETGGQKDQETNEPHVKPFPDRKIVIYFKYNSNDLPEPAYETLNRIAEFMIHNPEAKVNISGYTDSFGSYSYNMSVSQFRANIVKGYLVGKGVSPLNIEAVGLGPENPIANNQTEKGRQTNRRVEIELNIDQP
ncbi:MAG: OmpA family protein [Desulfobacterales bacterium]|jgi:general secretion pathway protein A